MEFDLTRAEGPGDAFFGYDLSELIASVGSLKAAVSTWSRLRSCGFAVGEVRRNQQIRPSSPVPR